jgi:hypothetical protein
VNYAGIILAIQDQRMERLNKLPIQLWAENRDRRKTGTDLLFANVNRRKTGTDLLLANELKGDDGYSV